MSRIRWRTARKQHRCDALASVECQRRIQPGDRYLETTLFPGEHNLGLDKPARYRRCPRCSKPPATAITP